jgi:hypothetical protein
MGWPLLLAVLVVVAPRQGHMTVRSPERPGYLAYRDHPEHRAMISQFVLPVAAQRVAVQYEF